MRLMIEMAQEQMRSLERLEIIMVSVEQDNSNNDNDRGNVDSSSLNLRAPKTTL